MRYACHTAMPKLWSGALVCFKHVFQIFISEPNKLSAPVAVPFCFFSRSPRLEEIKQAHAFPYIYIYRMALSQSFDELCGLLMRSLPWQFFPAKLPYHTPYIYQRTEWNKPGLFRALAAFLALIRFSSQDPLRLVRYSHTVWPTLLHRVTCEHWKNILTALSHSYGWWFFSFQNVTGSKLVCLHWVIGTYSHY